MQGINKQGLWVAGSANMIIALLHLVVIFVGAPGYRYFGAGEDIARMAEAGSILPALLTLVLVSVFIFFAIYAFSGGKIIRPLPFLKPFLYLIGTIYTLRGLFIIYNLYWLIVSLSASTIKELVFSLVALGIGLLYLAGAKGNR